LFIPKPISPVPACFCQPFALRQLMSQAAWDTNVAPAILSFKGTVYILRRKVPQTAAFSPSSKNEPENGEYLVWIK
jgi:hypothetical protein